MKEHHYAYQITEGAGSAGLVCTYGALEDDSMLDLLKEIKASKSKGLYWVFKRLDGQDEAEPLCVIDCMHQRIYYHFSGQVDDLDELITKLSKS